MDMDDACATVLPLVADEHGFRSLIGWLVPGDDLRVDYPGNHQGPVPARWLAQIDHQTLTDAIEDGREVLLIITEGFARQAIIVGLLAPAGPTAQLTIATPEEVEVDGRRVEIEGRDEIVLRCGKASITLRRNGRLILRGTYLETSAEGVNRIRGGSVQIN